MGLVIFEYYEMKVTILGNNSATPAFGRHPTAQTVAVNGEVLLIDCGEGTQIQMQRYAAKWRKLHHIFISHMHGDHYFGLPGLINSMSLGGRTDALHLYGPAPLMPIIEAILAVADTVLSYPLIFHPLPEGSEVLVETHLFRVTCFPVIHRIACHGFLVEASTRGRKLLPARCEEYGVPVSFYDELKNGEDYSRPDGTVVKNYLLTEPGPSPKRYAYCADTLYTETILPYVKGVDTMYHEATYLEADADKAVARYHTTAKQAAQLAALAGVKQLLLGHFSSKYKDVDSFMEEASPVFANVVVTVEGNVYEI